MKGFDFQPAPLPEPPPSDASPRLPSMADLLVQASLVIFGRDSGTANVGGRGSGQMFQTGSGKAVPVKEASIRKAMAILGESKSLNGGGQMCEDTSSARSCFSSSLFQTASGKTIRLSSKSFDRANNLFHSQSNQAQYPEGCESFLSNISYTGQDLQYGGGTSGDSYIENSEVLFENRSCLNSSYKQPPDGPCMHLSEKQPEMVVHANTFGSLMHDFAAKDPPIMFQTAGGRSMSVSSDALKRAMNLLGASEFGLLSGDMSSCDSMFSFPSEGEDLKRSFCNKENTLCIPKLDQNHAKCEALTNKAQSGFGISAMPDIFQSASLNFTSRGDLHKPVDPGDYLRKPTEREASAPSLLREASGSEAPSFNSPMSNNLPGDDCCPSKLQNGPLVCISNNIHAETGDLQVRLRATYSGRQSTIGEKRRLWQRSSVSPFKQPRRSRFFPPLVNAFPFNDTQPEPALSVATGETPGKRRISVHYPFQHHRRSLVEFFQLPPCHGNLAENLPEELRCMNADSAAKFTFTSGPEFSQIGSEDLWNMLIDSGASLLNCSKEWVHNHYKWIVWKLASLERCYPAKANGKFLTVPNVLEELKYRYEREVNHGHRSAIKKILEGDASCTSMMILCISAVRSYPTERLNTLEGTRATPSSFTSVSYSANPAKIELTDGWYSLNAILDVPLSKQLALGKLFLGQKLRVWGASLLGWSAPVSPLQAGNEVALLLHTNGTYRTHWAGRLGFCKGYRAPLSFRCIKVDGGPVVRTLVGITRMYPLLYRERLQQGGFVIRSERMETKLQQTYKQRCTVIEEGIMSELHAENFGSSCMVDNESEGAHIFELLETSAEPEMLMATLTLQQLVAYKNYQAKKEEMHNSEIQKRVKMALDAAGLRSREVTPFRRVQVVSVTTRKSECARASRRGLITIWEPTEKQIVDLKEGQLYSVTGLVPLNLDHDILHLQTRGAKTTWELLPSSTVDQFEPFFEPRVSTTLSRMGGVPISSEFDIPGLIVYIGDVYLSGNHKKQWVFLTDGSTPDSVDSPDSLLAISFSLSVIDADICAPINSALTGSTVVFCNLVKRARDQTNQLWVAEAIENSTYSCCSSDWPSHLKEAADCVRKWSRSSSTTIQKLREKVLQIISV